MDWDGQSEVGRQHGGEERDPSLGGGLGVAQPGAVMRRCPGQGPLPLSGGWGGQRTGGSSSMAGSEELGQTHLAEQVFGQKDK